jgi:hypothetical protein
MILYPGNTTMIGNTSTMGCFPDHRVIRNQSGERFGLFPPPTPTQPPRNSEPDTRITEIIPWLISRAPTKINPY